MWKQKSCVHKTFLGTFPDKTVGCALKLPGESLIDIVFIGIIDSAGWLNVYVTEQGCFAFLRFARAFAQDYSYVSSRNALLNHPRLACFYLAQIDFLGNQKNFFLNKIKWVTRVIIEVKLIIRNFVVEKGYTVRRYYISYSIFSFNFKKKL